MPEARLPGPSAPRTAADSPAESSLERPEPAASGGGARGSDARLLQRLPVRVPVRLAGPAAREVGETRDLTLAGMFLATAVPFRVGDVLALELGLPGGAVTAEGVVVRIAPEGVGLRFSRVADAELRRLRRALVALNQAVGTRQTAELLHARATAARTEKTDPDEVRALLDGLRAREVRVRVLPPDGVEMSEATLVEVDATRLVLRLATPVAADPGAALFVLGTLEYVSYSFRGQVVAVTPRALELTLPERVVHAERRGAHREPARGWWLVVPREGSGADRFPVLDHSDGGLGVSVDEDTWPVVPGASIPGARLETPGGDVELDGAVVRNVRRADGRLRVGVSHGVRRRALEVRRERVAEGTGLPALALRKVKEAFTWVELKWRGRKGVADPLAPERVTLASRSGRPLVGLLQRARPEAGRVRAPLVLVVPGFGGRKEQMSYLASILVETFRARGADLAVLRLDGTNNLGESGKDEGCDAEGRHTLHYTVGGVIDDARGALDWARDNPLIEIGEVVVVSVSFSSCGVLRWLADDAPPEVRLWISYMGAPDAQDGVRNVSGHYDVFAAAASGAHLGLVTLIGCLVDARCFWDDLVRQELGTLALARRDIARVGADVWWVSGRHDAFMNVERVKDLLSVEAPGGRALLEVDSGHVPRTGGEAIRQFRLIAAEVWRRVHGTEIDAASPSLGQLEARRRAEWSHTRRAALGDPVAFWRDYLLGDGGYDVMAWLPAYRELVAHQVERVAPAGRRVLDVGGGTGNVSAELLDRGAAEVVCLDLVEDALAVARTKAGARPLRTIRADLGAPRCLPVPDASADGAVASLLLSYLDHPEHVLAELMRALRPGAPLVVSSMRRDADTSGLFLSLVERLEGLPDDAFSSPAERAALLDAARAFHGHGAALFRMEEEGTFRFYADEELVELVTRAGFVSPVVSHAFGAPPQAVVVTCRRP